MFISKGVNVCDLRSEDSMPPLLDPRAEEADCAETLVQQMASIFGDPDPPRINDRAVERVSAENAVWAVV